MWVLPRQTEPRRRRVPQHRRVPRSGTRPASSAEPASVATPAVSNRSFQLTGTPSSGPRRWPVRGPLARGVASARARSGVSRA
jgi:hypothetical protein